MRKILLTLCLLSIHFMGLAQYDFKLNGRNDVPVMGRQTGFIGGGFTAMLKNRDDMNADQRLDLESMNFSYGGGLDHMWWFQPTVAFGFQLMYWQAGGAYSGVDTINKLNMKAKTTMSYFKLPLLFHFKSYNRYYPDRAVRFNACFGPYVALMTSFKDSYTWYNEKGEAVYGGGISGLALSGFSSGSGTTKVGTVSTSIMNPFELGFVFGIGGEIRITRRTVLSLMIRTDIGITDVENKKKNKIKYDGANTEVDFDYWKDLYAKYTPATAGDKFLGWESNRPDTKNFSVGGFLSFRKYFRK